MFCLSLFCVRNLIIEEKSFVPCEDLKYGRISFKGFNPEVEVCFDSFFINLSHLRFKSYSRDQTEKCFSAAEIQK